MHAVGFYQRACERPYRAAATLAYARGQPVAGDTAVLLPHATILGKTLLVVLTSPTAPSNRLQVPLFPLLPSLGTVTVLPQDVKGKDPVVSRI